MGRSPQKLADVQKQIEERGGEARSVVCDLSDMDSVGRAAQQILDLELPIAGLLNNAGLMEMKPTKSAQGWDTSYATNHLGPFMLTEMLIPHLYDGTTVIFVASGVEDPERGPAKMAGFRGARYISAEASARGEWVSNGSKMPGADAYATTKQCTLAAAMELSRENPRLRINALEPGFNPATALGHRDAGPIVRFLSKYVGPIIAANMKYGTTNKRAAGVITQVLLNAGGQTGIYFDDRGRPMQASAQARDPKFTARVVEETRTFLATSAAARTAGPR